MANREKKERKTILIVEDEKNIANAEKMILDKNFVVHLAYDGKEGWSKLKALKPHVVVLDIMLPEIDGLKLCEMIRSDEELKNMKIVMVTAKDQRKDEDKGMKIGADDYIMKPFEPIELMHVVNQVLKK